MSKLAAQQSIRWPRDEKEESDSEAHARIEQELTETMQDLGILAEQQEINNHLNYLQKMVDSAFIKLEALELENIKLKAENAQLVVIIRDMAIKESTNA